MGGKAPSSTRPILGVHPNVFLLGLVSCFTDVSTEMVFTTLPLFLANVLGMKTAIIGLIEGMAETTANVLRIPSGWLSDRWRRKPLAVIGYSLSTVVTPLMYIASSWGLVLGVRVTDRMGKGIRVPARDALLADSAAAGVRGRSFGFHRALDTSGSLIGLALAAMVVFLTQRGTLVLTRSTYQWFVIVGTCFAVLAVALLVLRVREGPRLRTQVGPSPRLGSFRGLSSQFKVFLGITILFNLGQTHEVFLILRAQNLGLSVLHIMLLLVLYNLIYAFVSTPAGIISDKVGRKAVLLIGWLVYALLYLGFALSSAPWQVILLFVVSGLYMGGTAGVGKALVADVVAAEQRGIAYGLYNAGIGITALPAGVLAGWLWQTYSPAAPFFFGAATAGVSLFLLAAFLRT